MASSDHRVKECTNLLLCITHGDIFNYAEKRGPFHACKRAFWISLAPPHWQTGSCNNKCNLHL
eukprot:1141857-Pelagomonas_calceolata.AAC.5